MAENTKTPPNQDQRQRPTQGDINKPEKPGNPGSTVNNPDRSGTGNPGRPMPGMDPDRGGTERTRPGKDPAGKDPAGKDPAGKDRVTKIDGDDDLDDDVTQTQRRDRSIDRE